MSRPLLRIVAGVCLVGVGVGARPTSAQEAETVGPMAADFRRKLDLIQQDVASLTRRIALPEGPGDQAGRTSGLVENLHRRADALWKSTLEDCRTAFDQERRRIQEFNQEIRRFDFESTAVSSRIDLLNNLGTYPTRAAFDAHRPGLARNWEAIHGARLQTFGADFEGERARILDRARQTYGIDLAALGFGRDGSANPYLRTDSAAFFGPGGELLPARWEQEARGWTRYRKDCQAARARHRAEKARCEQASRTLNAFRDEVLAVRRTTTEQIRILRGR